MSEALKVLAVSLNAEYQETGSRDGFHRIKVGPEHVKPILDVLLKDSRFWCDQLISISGFHQIGPPQIVQIHYHLASIPTKTQVHIFTEKVLETADEVPEFDSVADLWKTANWHERETAELYGIQFKGHPDLRKLLLPGGWIGFPLRKNYVEQTEFHGIQVKYEK